MISRISNSTIYNTTYYRIKDLLTPNKNTLVSVIESQDMIYGDYYTASIINYFRRLVLRQEKVVTLSVAELSEKLQFNCSIPTISKRIKELESNGILKSSLNGRVYKYEINTELILKTLTPEVVDNLSTILTNILRNYLKGIGKELEESSKEVFARMLLSGYDFPTIKQIIAYLAIGKSRYSEIIFNATHIKSNYDELARLSKHISKRKANSFIYKFLNNLYPKKEKVVVKEKQPNVINDYQLWQEIEEYFNKHKNIIRNAYYKYSYATNMDIEDIYQEARVIIYNRVKRGTSLENLTKSKLHGEIQRFMDDCRCAWVIDNDLNEDITANQVTKCDPNDDVRFIIGNRKAKVIEKFKHIPKKAMNLILDKLGFNGVVYTYEELAKKYNMSDSALNKYLKPYFDEIQRITGVHLEGKGYNSP